MARRGGLATPRPRFLLHGKAFLLHGLGATTETKEFLETSSKKRRATHFCCMQHFLLHATNFCYMQQIFVTRHPFLLHAVGACSWHSPEGSTSRGGEGARPKLVRASSDEPGTHGVQHVLRSLPNVRHEPPFCDGVAACLEARNICINAVGVDPQLIADPPRPLHPEVEPPANNSGATFHAEGSASWPCELIRLQSWGPPVLWRRKQRASRQVTGSTHTPR